MLSNEPNRLVKIFPWRAGCNDTLREPWPNGQTKGQINQLKTLKRQMCGRANIDLLKVFLVAAP